MIKILRTYQENDFRVTEYTKDGVTVSHTIREPIATEIEEEVAQPYNPSNTEIAQMISDLQADLIIAGVI